MRQVHTVRDDPKFIAAIALRDQLISFGWRPDLIAVEAIGMHIGNGQASKGYRVVLAWPDGRLQRVTSLAEAKRFLDGPRNPTS